MNPIKLKFWASHGYNALFEGHHGTGKTASVKQVFTEQFGEQGRDWLYFSAATMDAWVDFVGVPREVVDEKTGTRYLDLIRPKALADGTVKAIFFDEFNRAPAKTRNAVMELLQFKSINGKRFDNLSVIWAAINPDGDDVYDVERLDPAQKDRFDVYVKVPYDVNREYFFEKYKKAGHDICDWWQALEEDQKHSITPRRLETVLRMFQHGGDITDILPEDINPSELLIQLQDGAYTAKLKSLFEGKNVEGAREALVNENFYNGVESTILDPKYKNQYIQFFVPLMPNEKIAKLFSGVPEVRTFFVDNLKYSDYAHIFDSVIAINSTKEQRDATGMNASVISKLKLWKRRSGGDDMLTDVEYIDMISSKNMNIEFFRNAEDRARMHGRIEKILGVNNSLQKSDYLKMLGAVVELYNHYRDADILDNVKGSFTNIRDNLKSKFDTNIVDEINDQLPGLRHPLTDGVLNKLKTSLSEDNLI